MHDAKEFHAKMKHAKENLVGLDPIFFEDISKQEKEDWMDLQLMLHTTWTAKSYCDLVVPNLMVQFKLGACSCICASDM